MDTMTWIMYGVLLVPVMAAAFFIWYKGRYNYTGIEVSLCNAGRTPDGKDELMPNGKVRTMKFGWTDKEKTLLKTSMFGKKRELTPDAAGSMFGENVFIYGYYRDNIIPMHLFMSGDRLKAVIIPDSLRHMNKVIHQTNAVEFVSKKAWYEQPGLLTLGVIIVLCVLTGVTIYFVWKFTQPDVQQLGTFADAINNLANNYGGKPLGVPPQ